VFSTLARMVAVAGAALLVRQWLQKRVRSREVDPIEEPLTVVARLLASEQIGRGRSRHV
jgi:hypothetical protein